MNTENNNMKTPLYFSYDPDDGIEFHDTPEAAKSRAETAQDNAEFFAADSDGWMTDNQDEISWGQVFGHVVVHDREPDKDEKEENPDWVLVRKLEWRDLPDPAAEIQAMRKAMQAAYEALALARDALEACREDSAELLSEHHWWANEPRCGYQIRYAQNQTNIARAATALAAINRALEEQP